MILVTGLSSLEIVKKPPYSCCLVPEARKENNQGQEMKHLNVCAWEMWQSGGMDMEIKDRDGTCSFCKHLLCNNKFMVDVERFC